MIALRFQAVALAVALGLAGCGGGGGAPASPLTPESFETPEFKANPGLDMVGAQLAFAEGATGDGVTVAVVDTGIDTTHPDLKANISPDSIDIVVPDFPVTDDFGHGTFVAGIVAATKNNVGMHGVAFNTTILAIRADEIGGSGAFLPSDVAAGITYAVNHMARIVNLSLGGPSPAGTDFEQTLIDAMNAGAIILAGTGNESDPDEAVLEPFWPAAYAGDATVNASGQLLAVGAVDTDGSTIASFSNYCGAAMEFCLVAPGVDIVSTVPTWMFPDTDYGIASGTSFATPHVSGAAALLIQMFPALTASEVVQILLITATDLGAAGVDAVYGHGLLNLAQAVQPIGMLSVPLTDSPTGESVDINLTMLSLGPAFGDAMAGNALLDRALALDDFDRPYIAGLGESVVRAHRSFGLQSLLAAKDIETVDAALPGGLSLAMGVSGMDVTESLSSWLAGDDEDDSVGLHGFSLSGALADDTAFRLGHDVPPEQQLSGGAGAASARLYWMAGDTLSPHYALVGAGNGVTLTRRIGSATTATVGWVDENGAAEDAGGDARIGELTMEHRFGGGSTLRTGFALIEEADGFLGSDAAGAFAIEGALSRVYTVGGAMPLGAGIELIGSYTLVDAAIEADGTSLLSDWSAVRADAFGLGVTRQGVFGAGDRIGLLVGQPLRVRDAAASLTAPAGYTLDKTLVQDTERVSLAPTGREIDVQVAYDTELTDESRVSTWLMMQLEPGHIAGADAAYGVGLRLQTRF